MQGARDTLQTNLQQARSAQENASQRLNSAQTQLQQVQGTLETTQSQLQTARSNLQTARSNLQTRTQQLTEARTRLQTAQQRNSTLNQQVTNANNERKTLAQQLSAATGASQSQLLKPTGAQLRDARARARALSNQLSEFLVVSPSVSELSDAQRNTYNSLRQNLKQTQENVARLTGAQAAYTVRSGDSLSLIALTFYGNGNRWPDILEANSYLENAKYPYVGMVLVIP